MFKFNFSEETDDCKEITSDASLQDIEINMQPSQEIVPEKDRISTEYATLNYGKDFRIKHVLPNTIIDKFKEESVGDSILQADGNDSDLISGIYEGGLKIWECTHDLANYICNNNDLIFLDKRVLDLGCGAGIIGILSLLKGSHCDFQDYNKEIVSYITVQNVAMNVKDKLSKCRFYSGDWLSFLKLVSDGTREKYDVIFTCETIYNPVNYQKLNKVFKELLKSDGSVYLAAKTYYFGVGGGLRQFEELIKAENIFECRTCWICSEGVQREIIQLKFKNK